MTEGACGVPRNPDSSPPQYTPAALVPLHIMRLHRRPLMHHRFFALATLIFTALAGAQSTPPAHAEPSKPNVVKTILAGELSQREWTINGEKRLALLHIPEHALKSKHTDPKPAPGAQGQDATKPAPVPTPVPVIFAFHGHGGSARQAAASFHLHKEWPDALVVYMQGLPTPSALVDPEGKKNGWQNREGIHGNRDLKFFDAVLASLKIEYHIDEARIYATGHSNGGGFTYLLWRERADAFAAFAPCAAGGARLGKLTPKPAMHIAGRNDELVAFSMQTKNMDAVKKANACGEKGEKWAENCTLYPSNSGTPFVAYIHDGTHKYPAEAPALIAKFFKEHAKPAAAPKKQDTTPPTKRDK